MQEMKIMTRNLSPSLNTGLLVFIKEITMILPNGQTSEMGGSASEENELVPVRRLSTGSGRVFLEVGWVACLFSSSTRHQIWL